MNAKAMEPLGHALLAYVEGDLDAELAIRRDDGLDDPMPMSHFFRDPSEFTDIEKCAISLCAGLVLDVGAGSGLHSLVLQEAGFAVTAIDVSPEAVQVMTRRGVKDVRNADIFGFRAERFDTVLLLGHGIGMVENIAGLDRFLTHARSLVTQQGNVLFDSCDVRCTTDVRHLAYQDANREAGRYLGEIRLQIGFRGELGPSCGWLHVDPDTVAERAEQAGWKMSVVCRDAGGQYLGRLTKLTAAC
jgi:SAM-dependent methyltransferase